MFFHSCPLHRYENAFLLTILKDYGEQTFWIGLNDKHTENRFRWTDAASTTYTNWNTREPANSPYKDCVEITSYQQAAGRWNLIPCSAKRRYICESRKWDSVLQRLALASITVTIKLRRGRRKEVICAAWEKPKLNMCQKKMTSGTKSVRPDFNFTPRADS